MKTSLLAVLWLSLLNSFTPKALAQSAETAVRSKVQVEFLGKSNQESTKTSLPGESGSAKKIGVSEANGSAPAVDSGAPQAMVPQPLRTLKDWLGITLTSQFAGPALEFSPKNEATFSGVGAAPPSSIETPIADGYVAFTLLSFRIKNLFGPYAMDVQTRFRTIFNDDRYLAKRGETFQTFRWEAPRFGISGRLFGGETWAVNGAVNTDLPYTFPEPFTGVMAKARTLIATPGMFANFRWAPVGSRFSFFSILSPRLLIYEDRNAAEPEFLRSGVSGDMKPEFGIQLWPTVNFKLNDTFDFSIGTAMTFEKQVQSSWNPFVGVTRVFNEKSDKWRFRSIPLNIGVTYNLSKEVRIFPFVSFYPVESMREDARTKRVGDFARTASVGFEVTGISF
ncbi:MAG: hypothetical protein K2X47_19810 [Bdellovibrionales bacterium]|nr:hypothetical protein [Bdellovibrionales bacterium]